jgi:ipoprotein LpqH
VGARLIGLIAVLAAATVTAGCGLTGTEPTEPSGGRVAVGEQSRPTTSVACSQNGWALSIVARTDNGRARAALQIGGQQPVVRTVNIDDFAGLNGVAGSGVGKAEATVNGSSGYTIKGTAVISAADHPGQTTDMPFTIEAPC